MLNYNNPKDIPEMMKYHRTKDMINLLRFFPDVSPIRNLTIVKNIEDYLENYDFCHTLSGERNDTLITKPSMRSVESTGINSREDMSDLFSRVKALDPDGVLVLFDLCHEPSERYARYAGIVVGVSVGTGIYIDAVGKGFDGREVSKGYRAHERYFIPWFDIRKCNVSNFKDYRTFLITDEEYQKSRKDRLDFLTSVGLSLEEVSPHIPKHYEEIPNFIWLDVIRSLIKPVEAMDEELISAGLREFAISGHTEGRYYRPWQIFDKSRYTLVKK